MGFQPLLTYCCRTAPALMPEASEKGKLSIETSPRVFLAVRKALSASRVQTRVMDCPFLQCLTMA